MESVIRLTEFRFCLFQWRNGLLKTDFWTRDFLHFWWFFQSRTLSSKLELIQENRKSVYLVEKIQTPSLKLSTTYTLLSLTFLVRRNSRAVLQLLKKCGLFKIRPLSSCNLQPDKTSSNVNRTTPLLRSSISSPIFMAGLR